MNEIKYRINEIFYSIQGEGRNTGMPAVFIRFAGCNLKCSFCDTDHSEKMLMTKEEILRKVEKFACGNIILTGGEPTNQDIYDLIVFLSDEDYYICLETNGTNLIEDYEIYLDWITVSPKSLSNWKLRRGTELKLVYTEQYIDELDKYFLEGFSFYYLQPCDGMNNLNNLIDFIKKNSDWRLSLQCQKLINIK